MSSTSPLDGQWELVDQILEALGFDKSAGEKICSFELRIAVNEWPTVRMESKPSALNGGTFTKIFEVHPVQVADSESEALTAIPDIPLQQVCFCPSLMVGHLPDCPYAESPKKINT